MIRPPTTRFAIPILLISLGWLTACAQTALSPDISAFAPASPEAVGLSSERIAGLDRALARYVDEGRLPGYQLLIARDGRLVHEEVYGSMDLESDRPLRDDTIFRIYSMSKVVTGVATMIAWEQGHFLLTEPVSKYLPALTDLRVMVWDENGGTTTVPAEREVTILDLLRHTSGFSYNFLAPPPLGRMYSEAGVTPGVRRTPGTSPLGNATADPSLTLEDMVERLGELPLVAQPGSAWHYGISMDVLGRLIEVTSGLSFPEFLETHIFSPLEMEDTGFFVAADQVDRFAACYTKTPEGGLALLDPPRTSSYLEAPSMPGGGGGLVSTAADYLRFAQMLLDGGAGNGVRLLSPKTVELMMSNHLSVEDFGPRPLRAMAGSVYANEGLGVGFGFTGSVIVDGPATGLPISEGTFGWGGAASTFFWVDPEESIAVVFMTQLVPSSAYPIRAELMKGVQAAILD